MGSGRAAQTCVFGLSWGDEGKGKLVDLLCPAFDYVVRYNGGANAGHTVRVDGETFALHLLPAGVLHENVTSVIGPGVVVDTTTLWEELERLAARGVDAIARLRISDRSHLVLPHHKLEDQLSEGSLPNGARIGTTIRGIGPCYADKMKRTTAVRMADLVYDADWQERVRGIVSARRSLLQAAYGRGAELDENAIVRELERARERLADCVCDTTEILLDAIDSGKPILFEGANGVLLDVDHGTYPFVTSSSTGPHGIGSGAGVPPSVVTRRIGVAKAYATRVGAGPFVSELNNEVGERIRKQGHEFGTTTGRPRRCGWFDAVACRYAVRITGATDVALMHLDTLSGFDRVGICSGYRIDGQVLSTMPADQGRLQRASPVLEYLSGWEEDLRPVRRFGDLPEATTAYIERIEQLVGAPVTIAGVGPDRTQTLVRGEVASWLNCPEPAAV